MPHFIIEHTNNVAPKTDWKSVFKTLFDKAASHPTMDINAMKGRARNLTANYATDGNPDNAYIHLELAILSGRDSDLKKAIGEDLLALLPELFSAAPPCQFSVEIRDMARDAYFKQSL